MLPRYAVSAIATRSEEGGIRISRLLLILPARSEAEAIGLAVKKIQADFPTEDGWRRHEVQAEEIPERVADDADGPDQKGGDS